MPSSHRSVIAGLLSSHHPLKRQKAQKPRVSEAGGDSVGHKGQEEVEWGGGIMGSVSMGRGIRGSFLLRL